MSTTPKTVLANTEPISPVFLRTLRVWILCVGVFAEILVSFCYPAQARDFRSVHGSVLQAELIGVWAGEIVLQRSADEHLIRCKIESLSAPDQTFVREQAAKNAIPRLPEISGSPSWIEQNPHKQWSQQYIDHDMLYWLLWLGGWGSPIKSANADPVTSSVCGTQNPEDLQGLQTKETYVQRNGSSNYFIRRDDAPRLGLTVVSLLESSSKTPEKRRVILSRRLASPYPEHLAFNVDVKSNWSVRVDSEGIVDAMKQIALRADDRTANLRRAVVPLLDRCLDPAAAERVRSGALAALVKIGDLRCMPVLAKCLADQGGLEKAMAVVTPVPPPANVPPKVMAEFNRVYKTAFDDRSTVPAGLGSVHPLGLVIEQALARMKDPSFNATGLATQLDDAEREAAFARATDILGQQLSDDDFGAAVNAAIALGRRKDPKAADILARHLDDPRPEVAFQVAVGLAAYNRPEEAARSLRRTLPAINGRRFGSLLNKLKVAPESEREQVYIWVSDMDNKALEMLRSHWDAARRVLIQDLFSDKGNENSFDAAETLVRIGKEEIIPDLLKAFDANNGVGMAQLFLDSGNTQLGDAARKWASQKGVPIIPRINSSVGSTPKWKE